MMVMMTVLLGFAGLAATSLRTVALQRQRQTAAEVANARLEQAREYPYDTLALAVAPTHSASMTNPDFYVSADGLRYDASGTGKWEDLIVDLATGVAPHIQDPIVVGKTTMDVYQFVTWVDAPDIAGPHNYKRVTVVVRSKQASSSAAPHLFRTSTFITPLDSEATTTTSASTTTTTSAASTTTTTTSAASTTTTTTAAGPCDGDLTPPTGTFSIPAGASAATGYTNTATVTVNQNSFADNCAASSITANYSNDAGVTWGSDVVFSVLGPNIAWTLSDGDGAKSVTGTVRDIKGNVRALGTATIVLDKTLPTTPGTFTRTASCSGSQRTVDLHWIASTDTNLVGYRVYRSTDAATWSVVGTTTSLTYSETHAKTLNSTRFRVVAYDKAGNESLSTTTISLAKNQCS